MAIPVNDIIKIINEHSQLVLEVEGEATTEGTRVEQYTDAGKDHQWWRLKPAGPGNDGFYNLENVHSAMSLEVVGYSKEAGAEIVQRPYGDGPLHRQWELVSVDGKTDVYRIVNRNSGLVLDDVDGARDAPAAVRQYEAWNAPDGRQQWQLITVATMRTLYSAYVVNKSRNEISVISLTDGKNWSGGLIGHQTPNAPTLAVSDGQLWMAYTENGSPNRLWVISSTDGKNWSGGLIPPHASQTAPALAVFNGQLWMAYVVNKSRNEISVISLTDGKNWSGGLIGHQTPNAPTLAVSDGQLWMAYTENGSPNRLWVISSTDGKNWSGGLIPPHASQTAPALAVFNGQLWMAYVVNKSRNEISVISLTDGKNWSGGLIGHQTPNAPTLAVSDGQLWMAYTENGSPNRLWVISSADGKNWPGGLIPPHASQTAPALASL